MRAEWRFVWEGSGGLCVTCMVGGGEKRQELSAGNST